MSDISGILNGAYQRVRDWLFSSPTAGCSKKEESASPAPTPAPTSSSEPIVLENWEITALIQNSCNLENKFSDYLGVELPVSNPLGNNSSNQQDFWYAVARYLVEIKYNPTLHFRGPSEKDLTIRKGIKDLSLNQREALIIMLANKLNEKNAEANKNGLYVLLPQSSRPVYDKICQAGSHNLYDLAQRETLLSYRIPVLTKEKLIELINQARAISSNSVAVLNNENVLGYLRALDAQARAQLLKEFEPPFVSVCSVSPNSGKAGQPLTVTLSGDMRNIYSNNTFLNGFSIDFGAGISNVQPQTPTLDANGVITTLPVSINIDQGAVPGPRNITIKVGETILETLENAFRVLGGVSRRQCSDGIDNDRDGKIDYPNDPDCTGPNDNSEGTPPSNSNECPPGSGRYPRDENIRATLGCPPWRD